MNTPKQIILVRKDIKLPKGKLGAQAAHASLGIVKKLISSRLLCPLELEQGLHPVLTAVDEWWTGSWTKVCLALDSIDDLQPLLDQCDVVGLLYDIVKDNGLTVYHGIPTITCIGIEPATPEVLDPIFGHLKLY